MNLHQRKNIRLKNYDYSQCNAYFITICTYNRANLFKKAIVGSHLCVRPNDIDPSKAIIFKWLNELEHKYQNLIIDEFVIMPDHIHFIIFNLGVNNKGVHIGTPLPEIIKWFKTQTTNDYIKLVKRGKFPPFDKHIWQRNYYEHIISNTKDYEKICKYIYENPLKCD